MQQCIKFKRNGSHELKTFSGDYLAVILSIITLSAKKHQSECSCTSTSALLTGSLLRTLQNGKISTVIHSF